MMFWIIYFLIQISFLGIFLGHFSQCDFKIFSLSASHGGWSLYSTPHYHKKPFYDPELYWLFLKLLLFFVSKTLNQSFESVTPLILKKIIYFSFLLLVKETHTYIYLGCETKYLIIWIFSWTNITRHKTERKERLLNL